MCLYAWKIFKVFYAEHTFNIVWIVYHFNEIIKQMYVNIYLKTINMFTKQKSGMVCGFYIYSLIIFFKIKDTTMK